MLLIPGVRIQTAQTRVIFAKDRSGGDYKFLFFPYLTNQKINFNDTDPTASGGVSVSFATLTAGSNTSSNAKAVFSADDPAVMSSGSAVATDEVEIFYLETGVGFFWGVCPKVKTRRQYVGGDGTKILVYVEDGSAPTVEHVVLVDPLNSDAARVYKLNGSGQPGSSPDITLTTSLRYCKLKVDGTYETAATPPAPIQAVVDYAKQQAYGAGY